MRKNDYGQDIKDQNKEPKEWQTCSQTCSQVQSDDQEGSDVGLSEAGGERERDRRTRKREW